MAAENIPKAPLNDFRALHKLGTRRLKIDSESALATLSSEGVVVALWDYAPPTGEGPTYTSPSGKSAAAKVFDLDLAGVPASAAVQVFRVDGDHGNVLKAYDSMGRPAGSLTVEADHASAGCGCHGTAGGDASAPRRAAGHCSSAGTRGAGDLQVSMTRRQALHGLASGAAVLACACVRCAERASRRVCRGRIAFWTRCSGVRVASSWSR